MSDASSPHNVRWQDTVAIVDVKGDIDLSTSREFQECMLTLLDKSPSRVVVNLAAVPYMDSSGIASLVKVFSRARKREIQVVLAALNDRTRGLLEITRLDTVFDIRATVEEALS